MLGYNAAISKYTYRVYPNFIATIKVSNSNLVTNAKQWYHTSQPVCARLCLNNVRRQEKDRTAISFLHAWPQEAFSEV